MQVVRVLSFDPDKFLCECLVMVNDKHVFGSIYEGHTERRIVTTNLLDSMRINYVLPHIPLKNISYKGE